MQVREIMTAKPKIVSKDDSVHDVARLMKEQNCGFIPVGDNDRLDGVVTDRDIVLRLVANGDDADQVTAGDIITNRVLYCFEDDDIVDAAQSMKEQRVYRLIVLNNREEKRLRGVVTLGDIARQCDEQHLVGDTTEGVCQQAA